MDGEPKDFPALVTHCTWLVIEGITKGEPLGRVMSGVIEFARRWRPPTPAPVKAAKGGAGVPLRDQLRLIAARCSDPEATEALGRIVARMDSAGPLLSKDEVVEVWQNMPGGPEGWLKSFGFLQFAEALFKRLTEKGGR